MARDLSPQAVLDFKALGASAIYRPRQILFSEGAPATGLYLVCHGLVKLYNSDRFGRDHILEVAGAGAVLGELILDGDAPCSVSAEAIWESQVCFLPRERLIAFVRQHPMTGVRLLAALSQELVRARRKVRDLVLKGAESRMAGLLEQLAGATDGGLTNGRPLQLQYSRRDLAEMIGVSTETAIRLLAKLKRKGAVTVDGRDLVIADAERLHRVAQYDETTP